VLPGLAGGPETGARLPRADGIAEEVGLEGDERACLACIMVKAEKRTLTITFKGGDAN
jgi:hypothetical protein